MSAAEGRVNGALTAIAGFPPSTDAVKLNSKIIPLAMPLYDLLLTVVRDADRL
jgi:hypothetical protein